MKKFFTGVVKFLTTLVILGGVAYAVVTYWDKIMSFVDRVKGLLSDKHICSCSTSAERDDYADWEE